MNRLASSGQRFASAVFGLVLALGTNSCALDVDDARDPLDLEPMAQDDKIDGVVVRFDPAWLLSDAAFTDVTTVGADAIQMFLEETPYGRRSFLADESVAGKPASQVIAEVAAHHGVNPIVLLVTLQKEQGLVSLEERPVGKRIDFAFGCGCPDGRACDESKRGFDLQLACAAATLRNGYDAADERRPNRAGRTFNEPLTTLDGVELTPVNRATSSLYAYTPHVLESRGGNWLFWNVWLRYTAGFGYVRAAARPFNEGFIGGACSTDRDCFFRQGVCLEGVCTRPCDRLCPDHDGAGWAVTFCVEREGAGTCVARCDASAPTCLDGQACVSRPRFNEPTRTTGVCIAP